MSAGYVYVVAFSHGTIKVGQTANLGARISQHRGSAKNFGVTVTDWWASPLHAEWQQNEETLKAVARDLGGTPSTPEYFTGVDFAALAEKASGLTFTIPQMPAPESRARRTVRLRIPDFMKLAEAQGLTTDGEISEHTGLDRSTVSRLMHGEISAGPRVIATILAAFPAKHFEDFFEVGITDERPARRARRAA